MADMMNVPVLGLVENMSYFECPDCGKKINVFGESKLEEVAEQYGVDILGRLPINPKLAAACDRGMIELYEGDWLDEAAKKLENL
jgi:Mrp family chromosome partitioning ATPase